MNDIAEELARRTSFKYMRRRAQSLAIARAHDAADLAENHPEWFGIMATCAGLSATAVGLVARKTKFGALVLGLGAFFGLRHLIRKTLP
jgi:hypothetical protein